MYVPAAFRENRLDVLHDVIRRNSFATLVSTGTDGPFATHLPVLLDPSRGACGTLRAHVAKPNPQWRHFAGGGAVLAVFQGPHAYVSPSWYASPAAVPTWNYVAVHAYGIPRLIEDEAELCRLLADTVAEYEFGRAVPWTMPLPEDVLRNLLRGIVGFEIPIDRLEGKAKLGQNRDEPDRLGAIAGLLDSSDPGGAAVAQLMRQTLEAPAGATERKQS